VLIVIAVIIVIKYINMVLFLAIVAVGSIFHIFSFILVSGFLKYLKQKLTKYKLAGGMQQ